MILGGVITILEATLDGLASPVGKAAVVITSLGVLWRQALRPAWRAVKGVLAVVDAVHAEFRPNGGSTLRDAIDRLERKSERLESRVADIAAEVETRRGPKARQRSTDSHESDQP